MTRLKAPLADTKGEIGKLKPEVARIHGLLAETKEKASLIEHHAIEVVI